MSKQIAVRIPDAIARSLDELVSAGGFETKAEAIRAALQTLVDQERRRAVGELIAGVPADPAGRGRGRNGTAGGDAVDRTGALVMQPARGEVWWGAR